MVQTAHQFSQTSTLTQQLDYLISLPEGYEANPDQRYPLILFLHGAGERGGNGMGIEAVCLQGLPKRLDAGAKLPFIVVSPQCPLDHWWSEYTDTLIGLLDATIARYRVDTSRVYLTGLSMGGFGSWHLAWQYPERFAAVAPICGGLPWFIGLEGAAEKLKNMPLWVFHGAKDTVVPIEESRRIVNALKAVKGNVKFTVYREARHDSWTKTYANPKLYEWLLQHTLPASKS
ncbi:MAG: prolyl oligopeptidase family serine peptidase [Anaerolineae bacterium]|nr:prolyl oligopeptidase family serine peptidase [Anaerolineae bacterium]